jgi:enoyl-CoA hydratase
MSSQYKSIRLEKNAGVAEVVLIGPGKGNAMGSDFWREMPVVFAELDSDEAVRAILVRGEGDHFSYGLDLASMMGNLGQHFGAAATNLAAERTRLLDLVLEMQQAFNRVQSCRKPVIAAVHGWCIGGGLDLIAACDIRLCSADARFSLREVKVAIVADLGSLQRLPRIIGEGNTRELAFTGKDITADRALRINLVGEVYETREALIEAAQQAAREIADNPPLVVQGIKRVMNYCADKSTREGLEYVAVWNSAFLQSNDLTEAMMAFRERRAPEFKGR